MLFRTSIFHLHNFLQTFTFPSSWFLSTYTFQTFVSIFIIHFYFHFLFCFSYHIVHLNFHFSIFIVPPCIHFTLFHHPGPPPSLFKLFVFFILINHLNLHFYFHFSIFIVPPVRACTRGRSALPAFLPEPREVMRTVGKQVTENFTFDLEKNNKMEFDVKKTRWH